MKYHKYNFARKNSMVYRNLIQGTTYKSGYGFNTLIQGLIHNPTICYLKTDSYLIIAAKNPPDSSGQYIYDTIIGFIPKQDNQKWSNIIKSIIRTKNPKDLAQLRI